MKKGLLIAVLFVFAFMFFACVEQVEEMKIAMITDVGDIDDKSFNQGTWEGIVEYATANDIVHDYFQPAAVSTADYVDTIEFAIGQGYNIIVCPGFLFEEAIHQVQSVYPDVYFILIDGAPHAGDWVPDIEDNTLSIFFNEHESGWLAGYAAVMEGFTSLGFTGGMAVPAVVRFGVGFVGGAYYAASVLDLEEFEFEADNYLYFGNFAPTPDNQAAAAAMYGRGVEVIHAAAGGAGNSVMLAAEEVDKWVIGVDIDQGEQSDTVITSALKALGVAVQTALEQIFDGTFVGGQSIFLGAAEDGVGLPTGPDSFDRFDNFTRADYDAIFAELAAGDVTAPISPAELEAYIIALGYDVPAGLIAKAGGS
ncbi:MAG: BMP family ABC transporter substrate-binding protein [Acholeplasmataceae bacterium]|nr:MAG: BMP family ABC transporter substrate-binding protein [Acholeplasmataceae bacterium]